MYTHQMIIVAIFIGYCSLNIHFIHTKDVTSKAKNVIPLLLLHGWPGSVREFYDIIPKLMKATDDTAYVVVAPSLVGYGFSEAAAIPGMNPTEMSIVFRNLMMSLGYQKFLIQGGDWGSLIGSTLATLYPENVIGYHSNMCASMSFASTVKGFIASFYPSLFIAPENVDFFYPASEKLTYLIEESGYMHLQATKPDTIGKCAAHILLVLYNLKKIFFLSFIVNIDFVQNFQALLWRTIRSDWPHTFWKSFQRGQMENSVTQMMVVSTLSTLKMHSLIIS